MCSMKIVDVQLYIGLHLFSILSNKRKKNNLKKRRKVSICVVDQTIISYAEIRKVLLSKITAEVEVTPDFRIKHYIDVKGEQV